jgi:endonuclease/exonuclease/phosphatase family metal-dependent hydrolase
VKAVAAAVLAALCVALARSADAGDAPGVPAGRSCRAVVDDRGAPLERPVAWTLRQAPRERRALDRRCDTVGPIVLRAADRSVVDDSPIAVIGWNIHVGGGDVDALVRQLESGVLTGAPVTRYVLLLEEAFRTGDPVPASLAEGARVPRRIAPRTPGRSRDDIVTIARRLGLSLFYTPSMRNGAGPPYEDRGNAILSTLPLEDLSAIELPFAVQRRIAIAASVRARDRFGVESRLRVAAAHLDARASWRRLWIFGWGWRDRQARALLDALDPEGPSVLGADLNTWFWPFETAQRRVAAAYPDTARTVVPAGASAHGRLDYLFVRLPPHWRSLSRRLDDEWGSDHRPIVGWFH